MTIGDIGEFALIERIASCFTRIPEIQLGPGDDAAVVRAPDGRVVVTTDMLVEGRHFRRDWSSGQDVGRKAAAQNLADIAAMGARPTALFVALGAPPDTSVAWVEELYEGLAAECGPAGAAISGGDVTAADTVVLGVTALGDLAGAAPVTRSGARPGDILAMNGRLGWAAAGLALLSREPGDAAGGGAAAGGAAVGRDGAAGGDGAAAGGAARAALIEAHRRPRPPYEAGPQAALAGATAMIDVSDGLVSDVGHIAGASGVRVDIRTARLRLPPVTRDVGDAVRYALTGGDDHALIATFPPDVALPGQWWPIGSVAAGSGVRVDEAEFEAHGWEHFR